MSKKKIILLIILVAVAAGAWYGYREFNRKNKDLLETKADLRTTAAILVSEYEADDSAANKKYLGKILEVSGNVKDIIKDNDGYYTVVLGDSTALSSVRCAMDTTHHEDAASLGIGTSVTLRGNCTGFNKDEMGLGSDVILNFGVVIPPGK